VAARLEGMDEAFLACLGVAADSAAGAGDGAAAARLVAIRDEVLAQASARMSPGLRVLDAATRSADPAERKATVLAAAAVQAPSALLIFSAASQLIDDMEGATVVPDAALLARLCLAREDVLDGSTSAVLKTATAAHAKMLHPGGAELAATLASNGSEAARPARRALVARACFVDGAWEALAAQAAAGGALDLEGADLSIPAGLTPAAASGATSAAAKRAPRPGRALTAIRALRDEMGRRGQAPEAAALEAARLDVLAVLEGVAYRGELAVVEPAATVAAEMKNVVKREEEEEEEEEGGDEEFSS